MMTRRKFLLGASCIAAASVLPMDALALLIDDPRDFVGTDVFARLVKRARELGWKSKPIGDVVGAVAFELLGTPYVGRTLELSDDVETCAVNLSGLDCATLYEAAFSFARMIKLGGSTPKEFLHQIEFIRYRGGKMNGYVSRLHYGSDYFDDNQRKGTVRVVTGELPGAEPWPVKVGFMTSHPASYRQLKAHPEWLPVIAKTEEAINRTPMSYLPNAKIADAEPHLKTGDILGLVTKVPGLDVSHTGLCYRDEAGVLRLLHASSIDMKVVLGERLSKHLAGTKSNTGIIVCRPLEPRRNRY
jgi:hypothetical protein